MTEPNPTPGYYPGPGRHPGPGPSLPLGMAGTPREEMRRAVLADQIEQVEALVALDPTLAASGDDFSPILLALYRARGEALDALLEAHQPVTFFEAAALGAVDLVRQVCEDEPLVVGAYTPDGYTALHLAAFLGHTDAMRVLLDAGAEVDTYSLNEEEATPLHAASGGRHRNACALLLERGASVNAQQAKGFTPLHLVARYGDEALAQLLVLAGADPGLEADNGKDPADLAYEFEHDALADYLRMHRQ